MVSADKDYYKTLGVSKTASEKQVRSAYRKLAKRLHPDRNPGDEKAEKRFKDANEAYEVLRDQKRRGEYDQLREMAAQGFRFQGQPGSGAPGFDFSQFKDFGGGGGDGGSGGFGSVFDMLFNRGGRTSGRQSARPSRPTQGQRVDATAKVPIRTASAGGRVTLTLEATVPCDSCSGTGGERTTGCPQCNGTGRSAGLRGPLGSCVRCGGHGIIAAVGCSSCAGKGQKKERRRITIKIPADTKDGTEMRLAGQGGPAPAGGKPGDLYLKLQIASDGDFRLEGADVISKAVISAFDAMLGTTVEIQTLQGEKLRMKVAPGTQPGTRMRLRGKGLAGGDHLVEIEVKIPGDLPEELQDDIRKLAARLKS